MGGGREKPISNGDSQGRGKSLLEVEELEDDALPDPPDGGWGWMVVIGSFMIHVIADGIVYSFGIFYMEFLDYYKGGKGETAWVGSLVPGVTLTVGPLASILTNKYGCRVTTIAGAIIAAAGFILSLFAPNLYFLYFSFGIMSGLGFGLIYLPAIVSVGYYFEEKRAFATGLAVCGSGLGAFIFNPFSKYLIDEYGWRGAILIEAAIILNCVLCGALFRPLKKAKTKNKNKGKEGLAQSLKEAVEMELFITSDNISNGDSLANGNVVTGKVDLPASASSKDFTEEVLDKSQTEVAGSTSAALFKSDGALHRWQTKRNGALPVSPLALENKQPQLQRLLSEEYPSGHQRHHHHHLTPGSLYQSGSLLNISIHRSHPALYITSITSLHDDVVNDLQTKLCCCTISDSVYMSVKQMCDFSLLKDVIFLMFVVSNFCTSIGFNMPFIFLTDRAVDEGISKEQAKWLVSIVGISNTVGRVLFGFMADRKGVNRLFLYNTALTICGVATALCPLCSNYPLLVVYACVFGLFIGVYVSLTSVVLVDLLGLEMLTNSFGLLLMFQGIATLIGPPIAGWLYDGTGSYDVSFIVAGVVVAISGLMLYFIPLVRRCLRERTSEEVPDDLEMRRASV